MSWVNTRTRQYKRDGDAEPPLLVGLTGCRWGELRGEEGEQGVSLLLLLAHQMTVSTWKERRVKKKVIVAV